MNRKRNTKYLWVTLALLVSLVIPILQISVSADNPLPEPSAQSASFGAGASNGSENTVPDESGASSVVQEDSSIDHSESADSSLQEDSSVDHSESADSSLQEGSSVDHSESTDSSLREDSSIEDEDDNLLQRMPDALRALSIQQQVTQAISDEMDAVIVVQETDLDWAEPLQINYPATKDVTLRFVSGTGAPLTVTNTATRHINVAAGGSGALNLVFENVVLNGGNTAGGIELGAGKCNISGASVQNCYKINGGGLYMNYTVATITDSLFTANSARFGGGLYVGTGASVSIANTTITGNSSVDGGGGIYGTLPAPIVLQAGAVVSHNTATGLGGNGGGIYAAQITMEKGSVVSENTARGYGGGISNAFGSSAYVTIAKDALVQNNKAGSGGGIYQSSYSVANISGTIEGNRATASSGVGGGVYIHSTSRMNFTGATITGNTATRGGGIMLETASGDVYLQDCLISGNVAHNTGGSGSGGGIYSQGYINAVDCVFSGNTADRMGGAIFTNNGSNTTKLQVEISGGRIENNSAASEGGGIYYGGGYYQLVRVVGTAFSGNSCTDGGHYWNEKDPVSASQVAMAAHIAAHISPQSHSESPVDIPAFTNALNNYDIAMGTSRIATFDPMGGTWENVPGYTTQNLRLGHKANQFNNMPYTVAREGYVFAGWYFIYPDGTHQDFIFGYDMERGAGTYYAKWISGTCDILYDSRGGSPVEPCLSHPVGEPLHTPEAPRRPGYDFGGWYREGDDELEWRFGADIVMEDMTLFASWYPAFYTIDYNLDGGTQNAQNPSGYTVESQTFALQAPSRNGYEFVGWSGTDISGVAATVTIERGSMGARTYTANWRSLGGGGEPPGSSSSGGDAPPPDSSSSSSRPVPPTSSGSTPPGSSASNAPPSNAPPPASASQGAETASSAEPPANSAPAPGPPAGDRREETLQALKDAGVPTVTIGGTEIPLYGSPGYGVWSLVSLLLTIAGLLVSLLVVLLRFLRSKSHRGGKLKFVVNMAGVFLGIIMLIAFLLIYNLSNLMVLVDTWTLLILALFIAQIVLVVLGVAKNKDDTGEIPEDFFN